MSRVRLKLRVESLEARTTPAGGELDPSFGDGGVYRIPPETLSSDGQIVRVSEPRFVESLPDGRLAVVANRYNQGTDARQLTPYAVGLLSADGRPVPTFGGDGWAELPLAEATGLAVQADGRILVAGTTQAGGEFAVVRLTADGSIDTTFGTDGLATAPIDRGRARDVTVRPDGRILVAGAAGAGYTSSGFNSISPGDYQAFAVAQFLSDGRPDAMFGDGGAAVVRFPLNGYDSAAADRVGVQSDGQVILAGSAVRSSYLSGTPRLMFREYHRDLAFVRLTSDGRPDATFGDGGRVHITLPTQRNGYIRVADARVLPSGRVMAVAGVDTLYAVRITADGQLDPEYGTGGEVVTPTEAGGTGVVIEPSGRVLLASGGRWHRLTADGRPDETFGTGGSAPNPLPSGTPYDIDVQPDGSFITTLAFSTNAVARVTGTGPVGFAAATPGTVQVGGTADGTGRILRPTGGRYATAGLLNYFDGYTGAVRTATADVTGDGVPDYVAAAGPGGEPRLAVIDGATGFRPPDFNAFEATFTGGLFVTAADLDGDGRAEVIVTPDEGGGPVVAVYDGAALAAGRGADAQVARFFGIDDPDFRGGARPAAGDIDGNGTPDVVVAAGFGGGPRVAVFDGGSVRRNAPARLMNDFFAFPGEDATRLRNGAFVTATDLTADGKAELIFGGGPGGGPRVFALDASRLLTDLDGAYAAPVANFFAGDESSRGGVRVAASGADVLVGSGDAQPSRVRVYPAGTFRQPSGAEPPAAQTLDPFGDAVAGGVFVG